MATKAERLTRLGRIEVRDTGRGYVGVILYDHGATESEKEALVAEADAKGLIAPDRKVLLLPRDSASISQWEVEARECMAAQAALVAERKAERETRDKAKE